MCVLYDAEYDAQYSKSSPMLPLPIAPICLVSYSSIIGSSLNSRIFLRLGRDRLKNIPNQQASVHKHCALEPEKAHILYVNKHG
jgi:hypothetical protein